MSLLLTAGPNVEPVTLVQAKAHLRVDGSDEDTLISSLIVSARIYLETTLSRALIKQEWSLFLDAWPPGRSVALTRLPVLSVAEVKTYDDQGAATVFASQNYEVDTLSEPARLVLSAGSQWPTPGRSVNGVEIAFTAGYGLAASDVPGTLQQAILLLIAHWFENREPVAMDGGSIEVPQAVTELIKPFRRQVL